ncbi:MAG: hypothetical protein SOY42_10830 [Clostridium sp.]|nr:hypothetical protein [Clostridium sp.]
MKFRFAQINKFFDIIKIDVDKRTLSHDYITKLYVYQKFGILEYNLVEQEGYIVQYSLQDKQYKITNVFKGDDEYIS